MSEDLYAQGLILYILYMQGFLLQQGQASEPQYCSQYHMFKMILQQVELLKGKPKISKIWKVASTLLK